MMSVLSLFNRIPGWLWWLAAFAWAGGIFTLSTHKGDDLPKVEIPHLDKIVHFSLFAIQAALLYIALRRTTRMRPTLASLTAFAAAALYGGTDEIHQLFTPGRSPDIQDWAADSLGAGLVFVHGLRRPRSPHDPRTGP
jgi:VanZ family protein